MGAYTGYVVQLFVPNDYTLSIIIALRLAFAVTLCAGWVIERCDSDSLTIPPARDVAGDPLASRYLRCNSWPRNIFARKGTPLHLRAGLDGLG